MESLKPNTHDIVSALNHFKTFLKIRKSSKLFRLENADQINNRIHFHNTGSEQEAGLIVMSVMDDEENIDPELDGVVVLVNADIAERTIAIESFKGLPFALHPELQQSEDALAASSSVNNVTGAFTVPARTTAVFVLPEQRVPVDDEDDIPNEDEENNDEQDQDDNEDAQAGSFDLMYCLALLVFFLISIFGWSKS